MLELKNKKNDLPKTINDLENVSSTYKKSIYSKQSVYSLKRKKKIPYQVG